MSESKRLPSLDQLAARINNANNVDGPSSSAASIARPRLPLTALRTSSSTSLNTTLTASSADSTAVQAPNTRSTSPSNLTVTDDGSTPSTPQDLGGDSTLTADKLEKLQQLQQDRDSANASPVTPPNPKKAVKGYKNIPSLDAITARLAKTRALSIDGSPKPPEPEMIEDPKTPGLQMKPTEHPLQHEWTIYHDSKAKVPFTPATANPQVEAFTQADSKDYEANLTVIGTFTTVEQFCRYFNWLKPPSKLDRNSNYHLFKSPIKPMWEDPANEQGGKWVLTMKNNPTLLDRCWNWVAMALVGEELEEDQDEICGAVVSLRSKVDRIQIWTRSKEDVEKINGIGRKLVKLLDVGEKDGIGLEFQYNSDDRPQPNKFLSIQSLPATSSFRSSTFGITSPISAGAGAGGGGFGHSHNKSLGGGTEAPSPVGAFNAGGALGGWRK